ncbi:MAG: serine hydrolase [Desertimonas sp.]
MNRRIALALAATVALVACAGDDETSSEVSDPTLSAAPTTAPPATAMATPAAGVTVTTPATPPHQTDSSAPSDASLVTGSVVADPALRAVLDQITGWVQEPTTVPAAAFAAAFLAEIPIDDVRAALASLGGGDWTMSDVEVLNPRWATAIITGPNGELLVDVEIDDAGQIAALIFENAGLREPPTSMEDLLSQLGAGGERTALVVADIVDGNCVATTDSNADQVMPIASGFKLYVLGAVAGAILDGELTWEQEVTIRPELRSPWVPLAVADGDTMTVRDLAQIMIEVSDNTATDHLMDLVGRDAVEAMLTTFGHHDPAITTPMLMTREMSVLKTHPELLDRFAAADEATRREILATEVAAAPTPGDDNVWSVPRAVFEVEWFATPNDLCRALAGLHAMSAEPGLEPIAQIMSTNPGMITDPARIDTVWFKGGSEPGVLVGAWLAQRTDGSWFVSAGGAASSTTPIDPVVIELVGSALNLDPS